MKKIRIITIVILICCLGSAGTIYAQSKYDEAAKQGAEVQRRQVCLECASVLKMQQCCVPDSRRYSGTREHKCGVLWTDTCTVTSYDAWGAWFCTGCGNVVLFEDEEQSDGIARHHCQEVHSKCGVGDNGHYNVCPFGG